MKREFKVEANVGAPQVAYRETITKTVEHDHTHKKQTGGSGQFAKVKIRFEEKRCETGRHTSNLIAAFSDMLTEQVGMNLLAYPDPGCHQHRADLRAIPQLLLCGADLSTSKSGRSTLEGLYRGTGRGKSSTALV